MTEAAHSYWSASKFEADMLCPGKHVLERGAPDNSNQYSAEGTAAHQVAGRLDRVLAKGGRKIEAGCRFVEPLANRVHQLVQFGCQGPVGLTGRGHSAAAFVAHHQHQRNPQRLDSVFE